jgi:acyl transferase domain-containing protein
MLQLRGVPGRAALAGSVNLMLAQTTTAAAQAAGMLAVDGRCKTLDSRADGYVRAEACAAFLLQSVTGTDSVPFVGNVFLKAAHVNQDGRSSSLTAPNGPSQQAVIRGALGAAQLRAPALTSLEMHGTGEAPDTNCHMVVPGGVPSHMSRSRLMVD